MRRGWIYILCGRTGTLYTGVTSNLYKRVLEHRNGIKSGFASKYDCNRLVYFEEFGDITIAIDREKQIKGWTRAKKIALIETKNLRWRDLAEHWGRQMLMSNQSIKEENENQQRRIQLHMDSSSRWSSE
jgi:putative endonuclease